MAKCKAIFIGFRTLKDGTKTGSLTFNSEINKHILVDLEGEIWLTNETQPETESGQFMAGKKEGIRIAQETIKEWLEKGLE